MTNSISAIEFGTLLTEGKAPHVVDVRTPAEFAECHVRGARLAPLDSLNPAKIVESLQPAPGTQIYLLCKGGTRAGKAAEQFQAAGIKNVLVVTGGTEACVVAGLPVERKAKAVIPLDGQVRIALGIFLLLVCVLAYWVHPYFSYLVPAFAVGLIFSGYTGFCGMAILLGKAPWNQNRSAESCRIG